MCNSQVSASYPNALHPLRYLLNRPHKLVKILQAGVHMRGYAYAADVFPYNAYGMYFVVVPQYCIYLAGLEAINAKTGNGATAKTSAERFGKIQKGESLYLYRKAFRHS